MNTFIISLEDKPGELARVAEAIATKGIDITSFAATTGDGKGTLAILTNDEAGTRKALSDAGCRVREVEAVSASGENKPGGLAAIAGKLAEAGINIEAIIVTGMSGGMTTVAIATSDPMRTRQIVGSPATAGMPA